MSSCKGRIVIEGKCVKLGILIILSTDTMEGKNKKTYGNPLAQNLIF
jgi:hypothetical protein